MNKECLFWQLLTCRVVDVENNMQQLEKFTEPVCEKLKNERELIK